MASKPKNKMPISERAKQFMPFSALKGLDEALREKERRRVNRIELSDEQEQYINRQLGRLKVHDYATVVFYKFGRYYEISGEVQLFEPALKTLEIDSVPISFDEISNITIKENNNEKD